MDRSMRLFCALYMMVTLESALLSLKGGQLSWWRRGETLVKREKLQVTSLAALL